MSAPWTEAIANTLTSRGLITRGMGNMSLALRLQGVLRHALMLNPHGNFVILAKAFRRDQKRRRGSLSLIL